MVKYKCKIRKNICKNQRIIMEISKTQLRLYSAQIFNYKHSETKYTRLESVKTQYVYRFLSVIDGQLRVMLNEKEYSCKKGDVVFLRPGDTYSFVNCNQDFSVFNVFFDFLERARLSQKVNACIYVNNFDKDKSSQVLEFLDASIFNQSQVFYNCDCNRLFFELIRAEREGEFKNFRQKAVLSQILCKLLEGETQQEQVKDKAQVVLDYILLNPQEDLSGENLQRKFGYHKNYINQLLKVKTGKSLGDWIKHSKINLAKILLVEMGYSPQQTAIELGYYDYSHFYKAFKQETGLTPSQFLG